MKNIFENYIAAWLQDKKTIYSKNPNVLTNSEEKFSHKTPEPLPRIETHHDPVKRGRSRLFDALSR